MYVKFIVIKDGKCSMIWSLWNLLMYLKQCWTSFLNKTQDEGFVSIMNLQDM